LFSQSWAEALYSKSFSVQEKCLGPNDVLLLRTLSYLSTLHYLNYRYKKAIALSDRALRIAEIEYGPNHRYLIEFDTPPLPERPWAGADWAQIGKNMKKSFLAFFKRAGE